MKHFRIFILFFLSLCITISCSSKEEEIQHKHKTVEEKVSSELVRKGIIDLQSLDTNKDGKIYECPMDWNVLDDKDGECPICGMKLKEFSIAEIKENLTKYGYEYKN